MRYLSLVFIFLSISYGYIINVNDLQKEFNNDVHTTHIFRLRYHSYLHKKCNDNLTCMQNKINIIKNWKSVQNDTKLKYYFNKFENLYDIDKKYFELINKKLKQKHIPLQHTQYVSVIDLSKQLYILTIWDQTTNIFHYIGKDYISSGNIFREYVTKIGDDHYFKTPSGVFQIKGGWRSNGKVNKDKKTLGYGVKNRYIFYFGKQKSIRYNVRNKNKQKIQDVDKWKLITGYLEFAMHAHQSSKPMGKPYSHGCVRTTDELNRYMEKHHILTTTKNKLIYGQYLIIFDKI